MELDALEEDSEFECCICQDVLPCSKSLADHLSRHGEDSETSPLEDESPDKKPITMDEYLNGEDIPHLEESNLDIAWLASDKCCPLCHKKSRSPVLLKSHYERHYNVTFRCHCQKTFSSMKTLLTHLTTHDDMDVQEQSHKTFLCLLCATSFNTIRDMKNHLNESIECGLKWNEANAPEQTDCELTISNFICALCQKAFNDWETMNYHVEGHYNPTYECTCKQIFKSEESLKEHSLLIHKISNVHTKTFNCLACKSSFSSIENMEKHLRLPFNISCLTTWKTSLANMSKCDYCHKKNVEESHIDSHFDVQYVCDCMRSFTSAESCHQHTLETKCTYKKLYTCENCGVMNIGLVPLKEHFKMYKECRDKFQLGLGTPLKSQCGQSIPDKLFTCKLCKKNYASKSILDAHTETHYNVIYICECSESFMHNEFNTHCLKVHNKLMLNVRYEKIFKCMCNLQFDNVYDIKQHLECSDCVLDVYRDLNEFLFSCPLCPKMLTTKTSLRCHHDKHYNVLFTCVCSRQFKLFKGFETHCTVDHVQTPSRVDHMKEFACFQCELTFDTIEELGVHLKESESCLERWEIELLRFSMKFFIDETKRFACHICQKSFDQKAQIRDHLESHFSVKYTCRRCSRVLTSKSNFRVHAARAHNLSMKTVGYDKKFVCQFCPKEFKSVEVVDKHMSLHQKNGDFQRKAKVLEDFKCKDCNFVFKTAKSLRHHNAYFTSMDMKCTDNRGRKIQLAKENGPLFVDVASGISSINEVMLTSEVTIQPRPGPTDSDPLCS